MLSDTQRSDIVKRFAQYSRDHERLTEYETRTRDEWQGIVALLMEWEVEPRDEDSIVKVYEEAGHKLSFWMRGEIHRAVEAASVIRNANANQSRKRVIERGLKGDKKVGKRRVDRALKTEKYVQAGQKQAAKRDLRGEMWDRHFKPLGLFVRDNHDVLTIEGVAEYFTNDFIPAWHKAFDEIIATEKKVSNGLKKQNG